MTEGTWPTLATREPNGQYHEVGESNLFFSTTDRRGVITDANSIFVELSRFPRERLMGAPHSIIRHPRMPGGAFKLMWETIQDGRPFCSYVDNQAADGSRYTVFASVTPLGEGYLSVRSRPLRTDLLDLAYAVYDAALAVEATARRHGMNRRGAAAVGLDRLVEALAEAGYPSYDEFMRAALSGEAELRARVADGLDSRPDATGPLAEMLDACRGLSAELRTWSGHQDALVTLAESLSEAIPQLRANVGDAAATAAAIDRITVEHHSPRTAESSALASRLSVVTTLSRGLTDHLRTLRESCAQTRFMVALAEYHTDALGQFIIELIDGSAPEVASPAITALCRALEDDFTAIREETEENAGYARATLDEISRAQEFFSTDQNLAAAWARAMDDQTPGDLGSLLPRIVDQLSRSDETLALLDGLSRECATLATPQPTERADDEVDRILGSLAALSSP